MSKTSHSLQHAQDRSSVALSHADKITKADPSHFILATSHMARNIRFICSILLLFSFIFVSQANAYQLYSYRWPQPTTAFYVDVGGPDGLWNTAFETAMALWGTNTIFKYTIFRGIERSKRCWLGIYRLWRRLGKYYPCNDSLLVYWIHNNPD
jgi:hypothetical protein